MSTPSSLPPAPGRRSAIPDALVRALAPYLGDTLANAAVRLHTKKMTLDVRAPTRDELEQLFERLQRGLVVFVGRTKTEQILTEARAAVRAVGGRV